MDTCRVKAFTKRMTQVLGLHQAPFACGILYVISQLQLQFPDIRTLFEEPEDYEAITHTASHNFAMRCKGQKPVFSYDGRKRNPEYSNSDRTCLWEFVS